MSFQRMVELARRHGMPVVVTDKEGKEPMVILPLDVYEAMVDGTPKPLPLANEPTTIPVRNRPTEADVLAELSMEERFYIEPFEEGQK